MGHKLYDIVDSITVPLWSMGGCVLSIHRRDHPIILYLIMFSVFIGKKWALVCAYVRTYVRTRARTLVTAEVGSAV